MRIENRFLALTVGTSRGRETYGYSLVTLTDTETNKKYRTCGGGYDMRGTVLADWLSDVLQDELKQYLEAKGVQNGDGCFSSASADKKNWPYGCSITHKKGIAFIDGGTGLDNVKEIAKELGYNVSSVGHKTKRSYKEMGYQVSKII